MNLSHTLPRSPRESICGVAMVARTADKARADAAGTLGAYTYACRMSRMLFAFIETDADTFREATTATPDDAGVRTFVDERLRALHRTDEDIAIFNQSIAAPPTPEAVADFLDERHDAVPDRRDIWTYVDLIDAEEGRAVPVRTDTPTWAA
ncbi:MAG: DUF5069 domain-containing protein [Chloroflexi bacterium]|jgi:hypothetical protein|nr:DUF5069 domain-containing protein [Chloroflexota bacterium]